MEKPNLSLVVCGQIVGAEWNHCFVSNTISDNCFISNKTKERGSVFPLFIYDDEGKRVNINESIFSDFDCVDPMKLFDYTYGTLYLPHYRKKYADQLRTDFPRIPLPAQVLSSGLLPDSQKDLTPVQVFDVLSSFGKELRELHLLTHPIFEEQSKWGVKFDGQKPEKIADCLVTLVKYSLTEKRVYINDGQYFEGIEPEIWAYHIGGYQVLDKWLKDRKKAERCLSSDDLLHYMKIVVSIRETIKLTKQFE
jgi:predicted helicase